MLAPFFASITNLAIQRFSASLLTLSLARAASSNVALHIFFNYVICTFLWMSKSGFVIVQKKKKSEKKRERKNRIHC